MSTEFDDVPVLQSLMNFDFAHQFLFRPRLDKRTFLYYFDRLNFLRFLIDEFITTSESALAQKIPLQISPTGIVIKISVLNHEQILMGFDKRKRYDQAAVS